MIQRADPITLIGEEIAGAWNSQALADIASAFDGTYVAFNGADAGVTEDGVSPALTDYDCLIAAENLPGAANVYGFRPPGSRNALLVGNEAKGLRRRTLKQAHDVVEIPLASRNINCLNVAA